MSQKHVFFSFDLQLENIIIGYRLCMGKYDDRVFWRVDGPSLRGLSATKNEIIIFSHTKSIAFLLDTFNFI
jgi:hypothetical protein